MKRTILTLLSITLMVLGLGCAALSSYVTPAEIDRSAAWYAYEAGETQMSYYDGYPNMAKAAQLKKDVDAAHNVIQLDLQQQAEKDNLTYAIHKDIVSSNLIVAQQREETLFGETGLLSMGLGMAGMGGFAGLIGLMRKRPGDVTAPEMEQALATATSRTTEELSIREKQFVQVVKGVQAFMDPAGNAPASAIPIIKAAMNKHQDSDTRAAVAVVKAS